MQWITKLSLIITEWYRSFCGRCQCCLGRARNTSSSLPRLRALLKARLFHTRINFRQLAALLEYTYVLLRKTWSLYFWMLHLHNGILFDIIHTPHTENGKFEHGDYLFIYIAVLHPLHVSMWRHMILSQSSVWVLSLFEICNLVWHNVFLYFRLIYWNSPDAL